MKALRACLTWLALYAVIAFAIAYVVERRVGVRQPAVVVGLIGGFIAWIGLGYLVKAFQRVGEVWLIWRAMSGAEPVDGQRFAAIGPINPAGRTLTSPITKSPAVAYSYKIMNASGGTWAGAAMTQSTIRFGTQAIKVLAQPELDFKHERLSGEPAVGHATEYIRNTKFEPSGEITVAHDGSFRQDIGRNNQTSSLRHALITEQVIKPGEEVCVFGRFSADRNALVADDKARIVKGTPSALIGMRASSMVSNLVAGAVTLAVVTFALTALYAVIPLDVVPDPSWPEVRVEKVIDEQVRPKLATYASMLPNIQLGDNLAPGQARGRIKTAAGETAITTASANPVDGAIHVFLGDVMLTLSQSGELQSANLGSGPVQVPPGHFIFRRIAPDEIAGRLSWPDGGVHVVFRTNV